MVIAHAPVLRLLRSVQATYLRPLRRKAQNGIPTCDLQLRSYSLQNLDLMVDLVMRSAYFLSLSASGPIPLPRLVERWTVSKGVFVHKKSQENFERITFRRLVQIQDAHSEVLPIWLAYLRKNAFHGVGMKANIWEHEQLDPGPWMDKVLEKNPVSFESTWARFGKRRNQHTAQEVQELLKTQHFRRV